MNYRKTIFIFCLGIFLSYGRSASGQAQSDTFRYTGNIVNWSVPAGCISHVTITAIGGSGGTTNGYTPIGGVGAGAKIVGTFSVTPGEKLKILVAGAGVGCSNGGGGGGGSFVTDNNNNPLCIAGGGGGYSGYTNSYSPIGMDADTGTAGYNGDSQQGGSPSLYGIGGVDGNGATGSSGCGGNGGGLLTNGAASNCCGGQMWGTAFVNGGEGGQAGGCGETGYGGFGGGGTCGNTAGGGGGGYSGGGCGYNEPTNGGGGGSYDGGTNPIKVPGYNRTGNGMVIISWAPDSIKTVSSSILSNIVCNGYNTAAASILVNGSPAGGDAFTYTWIPNVSSRDTASGLRAGIYTISVVGCNASSGTTTVTITQPAFFAPNPTVNAPLCYGDSNASIIAGAIGGTSPYTYAFSPGGNVPAIYNLTAGTYSLNILDNQGCATSKLITISQPAAIVANASLVSAPNCYGGSGGSAVVSVTGGTYPYGYAWSPSGGTNASATNLAAGNYAVTITDANGCKQTAPVTITQPSHLGVIVSPPLLNLACNGDNNGVLGSGVSGGTRPYTYFWSRGLGSDTDVTNLGAGEYYLTVTDAHGCQTIDSGMVVQPPALTLRIDSTFDAGNCSGSAWVLLSGGTPGYSYLWSNGSNNYYQTGLCAGEQYCCVVTDANGCKSNICTTIESDLGVGNISGANAGIKVYPNPNSGEFTVEGNSAMLNARVEVYNVLGEKVYTQTSNGNSVMTVNMSTKPDGVYLYRVISNEDGSLLGSGKVDIAR